MRLGLLLMLVASPLAAQSVRSRLEARVPMAAVPTVDSLVQVAAREGLPTEPLVQKALEGGAKHVSAPRIGAAAQEMLEQLRDARALLVRAGDAPPATAAEVTTIYAALQCGLPGPPGGWGPCPGSGAGAGPAGAGRGGRGRASRGRAGPRRGRRPRRDARYSLKPPSLARAPFRCA